jgi:hypothetical protein
LTGKKLGKIGRLEKKEKYKLFKGQKRLCEMSILRPKIWSFFGKLEVFWQSFWYSAIRGRFVPILATL